MLIMCEADFELMCQGAEARLYKGQYLGRMAIKKERFKKTYRHPDLDERLTKDRIKSEYRAIVRAKIAGVRTPAVFLVDPYERSIYMEYIDDAIVLKNLIEKLIVLNSNNEQVWVHNLGKILGLIIARLHTNNIIHGDLTTSNILVKSCILDQLKDIKEGGNLDENKLMIHFIVIDFGLAHVDSTAEDKAVDLYVLERSLLSSHSQVQNLFSEIMKSYQKNIKDKKQQREIISKYEEVKARGRKRLMIG
ncbi:EKC/KEOPS complex subunit Tp53rk isoform X2 [Chelonus insularis]|uniref:EKC/KEOPS complex subunit Tp53rk isoform X2 n=1 Tax=Chelonus insularis TaxID=460826 RepID=UPI00158CC8F9|nr:EKC/KEOPS complex subunit Tp53rk isoform X2 [Chelonus insularis]